MRNAFLSKIIFRLKVIERNNSRGHKTTRQHSYLRRC